MSDHSAIRTGKHLLLALSPPIRASFTPGCHLVPLAEETMFLTSRSSTAVHGGNRVRGVAPSPSGGRPAFKYHYVVPADMNT